MKRPPSGFTAAETDLFIFQDNTCGIKFWESIGWTYRQDIGLVSKMLDYKNMDVEMITINTIDSTNFEVTVEGNPTTTHQVSVTHFYYEKLTDNRVTPEELIEASFKFLLERESNTSILPRFDLPIIERYFPEYEKTIKKMLKR